MERKLKPDSSIAGLVISLSIVLVLGLSTLLFGYTIGFNIAAVLIWIYAGFELVIFLRTGNIGQLLISAYAVFLGFMAALVPVNIPLPKSERADFHFAYFAGLLFFGVIIIYLAATKKIKWRGREIFELAAAPVEAGEDSYTPRPMPIGKVDISPEDILSFARFARRNLISAVYINPRQVVFIPVKMGDEYKGFLRLFGFFSDTTWIAFDADGEVSVHISHKDYLDFKDTLAFDKLCESLGQLFIRFVETHRKGDGVRIIDRMNALKLGLFS